MSRYSYDYTTQVLTLVAGNCDYSVIAPVEVSPAEEAHLEGTYLIYNTSLYKVIDDIAIGDALSIGTNISYTDVMSEMASIQVETMPTASSSNEDLILQYVGTTTSTYTNGYFYKCVEDSGSYSWEQTDVQPAGGSTDIVHVNALPTSPDIENKIYETGINGSTDTYTIPSSLEDTVALFGQVAYIDIVDDTLSVTGSFDTYNYNLLLNNTGEAPTYFTWFKSKVSQEVTFYLYYGENDELDLTAGDTFTVVVNGGSAGEIKYYLGDETNQMLTEIGASSGHEIADASGTTYAQEDVLKFENGWVQDDSTNGATVIKSDNFIGTRAQWNALTSAQKANYKTVDITDEGSEGAVAMFATVEPTSTSSQAYAIGEYLVYNDELYRVTSAITQGSTITPNTNIAEVKMADEVSDHLVVNGNSFYFDYHDGQYGYNTSPLRGADTFSPFKGTSDPLSFIVTIGTLTTTTGGDRDFVKFTYDKDKRIITSGSVGTGEWGGFYIYNGSTAVIRQQLKHSTINAASNFILSAGTTCRIGAIIGTPGRGNPYGDVAVTISDV